MHKNKNGAISAIGIIAILVVVALLGVGSFFAISYGSQQQTAAIIEQSAVAIKTASGATLLPKTTLEFKFDAYDGSNAQNNESELDFDIFYWDPDKQSELKAQGYVDCSMATPYDVSHDVRVNELPKSAFCELNTYKMTQSFTVGNTETNFQEYLTLVQADVTSKSGSYDTRTTNVIDTGRVLLVTMGEIARTSQEDVVPKAFLIRLSNETVLGPETIAQIVTGNSPVQLQYRYNSFAGNHSRITYSGECDFTDSSITDTNLDVNWNGVIPSTQTTEKANADFTCELYSEINRKGYEEPLKNPLADGDSEKSYLIVYPYMEANGHATMVEYGRTNITGEIGYSVADSNVSSFIYSGLEVCGVTITSSSSTDARKNAAEKIYEPNCFPDVWDYDHSKWSMKFRVSDANIDYDATQVGAETVGQDEVFSGAGATAEHFAAVEYTGQLHQNPVTNATVTG